ncbi:PKD-like family lipoprotein [Pinibacter soli]|uniref:PKD-like family lipoprotein n=1 Tax=Pinibacter soli TaxID=3044211 RepID=A0ABT6RGI5_9BACT|nr:PKD-like family lipoprotein [Pinibacter soli]MDI3321480.1 PKD-like family lipoprotein [Pinibacter soli]
MNHKNIWRAFIVAALGICALVACKKDKGNYNYSSVNTITVITDTVNANRSQIITVDSISVKQFDTLTVNIQLSQTQASENLSYQWMIIQTAQNLANPFQYIVGTSKQLKARIDVPISVYRLVVKVTDNATGVSFYKFYALNVDSSPWGGEGWVVLQDQPSNGGCDIALIASRDGTAGSGAIYSNLYSFGNNGKKLPTGTSKVNVLDYSASLRIQKVSFFYPNGGLQVRSTDFADSSYSSGWFFSEPATINLQANACSSQYEYLINNNQLHYRAVNSTSIKTPPILFNAPLLGSWTLAPFVLNPAGSLSDYWFMLYDQANKCFLQYNAQTGALVGVTTDVPNGHFAAYSKGTAPLDPLTGSGFDLNYIGKTLLYAENSQPQSGNPVTYSCVFRNTTSDSTWLYQLSVGGFAATNANITGRYLLSGTKVPGINTAKLFAFPTFLTLPGKFYYVNGNTINTCTIATLATSTSLVGYTFPTGTIIKTMKVFKSGYATAPSTDSRVLVVATDETATGGGNKVYFLSLTSTGDINNTPIAVYGGFDKIVDVAFKKGLGL